MNRRDVLRAIALGGGIVAGELWIPGARKVFLPPRRTPILGGDWEFDTVTRTIHWAGRRNGKPSYTVLELYRYIQDAFDEPELIDEEMPVFAPTNELMSMENGWSISEEGFGHLTEGTVRQGDEYWTNILTIRAKA